MAQAKEQEAADNTMTEDLIGAALTSYKGSAAKPGDVVAAIQNQNDLMWTAAFGN